MRHFMRSNHVSLIAFHRSIFLGFAVLPHEKQQIGSMEQGSWVHRCSRRPCLLVHVSQQGHDHAAPLGPAPPNSSGGHGIYVEQQC